MNLQHATWQKVKDGYSLQHEARELVHLHQLNGYFSHFSMDNSRYDIHRVGFWTLRYEIKKAEKMIASVAHDFWISSGGITFQDHSVYPITYSNKNTITLQISNHQSEIVNYFITNTKRGSEINSIFSSLSHESEKERIAAAIGMMLFLSIFNDAVTDDASALVVLAS